MDSNIHASHVLSGFERSLASEKIGPHPPPSCHCHVSTAQPIETMISYADVVKSKTSNTAKEASSAMGINPVAEDVFTAVTSTAATTSTVAIDGRTFKVPRPTNSENWTIVGPSLSPTESRNLELNNPTPPHLQLRGIYPLSMKSVSDTDNNTDNSMGFQDMVHRTTSLSTLESRSRLETFKGFSPDADASKETDEDISAQTIFRQFLEDLSKIEGEVKLNEQEITEKFAVLGPYGALVDIVDNHVEFDIDKKCPAVASSPPSVPSLGCKNKPISLGDPNSTERKSKKVSMRFDLFIIIQLYRGVILTTINGIRYYLDIAPIFDRGFLHTSHPSSSN